MNRTCRVMLCVMFSVFCRLCAWAGDDDGPEGGAVDFAMEPYYRCGRVLEAADRYLSEGVWSRVGCLCWGFEPEPGTGCFDGCLYRESLRESF